ncbi:hypothetical protein HJFPF1_05488 [Paramyrothecium foliicola]|nr:hypothetical protein HJFPF1_05488 [Paramyrothecium foliicola]
MSTASFSAKPLKFIESDASGLPIKRKQAEGACDTCRKRKRRCVHRGRAPPKQGPATVKELNDSPLPPVQDRQPTPENPNVETHSDREDDAEDRSQRFVCDTNPEGMFAEVTDSDLSSKRYRSLRSSRTGLIGVWVSDRRTSDSDHAAQCSTSPFDVVLLPYVREHCLTCVPFDDDFEALQDLYFKKINPVFSLIVKPPSKNDVSPAAIVLRQVISLAAATDASVAGHLRLRDQGSTALSATEFTRKLSTAVRTTLGTSLIPDTTTRIQVLCILSLYFQPSQPSERAQPSLLFAEAITHAQTLGLHLHTGEPDLETLFCAIWAIDKVNSALWGRPRLLHEVDFSTNLEECFTRQSACFRLFLLVSRWLDRSIDLYRPGASERPPTDFNFTIPPLEQLVMEANAASVPSFLLSTIEVYYHSIVILSCRMPRFSSQNALAVFGNKTASSLRTHRSLAAGHITRTIKSNQISPVPLVPYAISLCLGIEYESLRCSVVPVFRTRAEESFESTCKLLEHYKDAFWSANVTYGLSQRVLYKSKRTEASQSQAKPLKSTTFAGSGEAGVGQGPDGHPSQSIQPDPGFSSADLPCFSILEPSSLSLGYLDPNLDLFLAENALEGNSSIDLNRPRGDWGMYSDWEQF